MRQAYIKGCYNKNLIIIIIIIKGKLVLNPQEQTINDLCEAMKINNNNNNNKIISEFLLGLDSKLPVVSKFIIIIIIMIYNLAINYNCSIIVTIIIIII